MPANTPGLLFPHSSAAENGVAATATSTPPSSGLPPPAYPNGADAASTATPSLTYAGLTTGAAAFTSGAILSPMMAPPSFGATRAAAASGNACSVSGAGAATYPFLSPSYGANLQPPGGVFFPPIASTNPTPNAIAAAAAAANLAGAGLTAQQVQAINAQLAAQSQACASAFGLSSGFSGLASNPAAAAAAMAAAATTSGSFLPPGALSPTAAVSVAPSYGAVEFSVRGGYPGSGYYLGHHHPSALHAHAPSPMLRHVQSTGAGPSLTAVANPKNTYGQAVLFVGQLNYDVTETDVLHLFSYYGQVLNVVLLKDATRSKRKKSTGEESEQQGSSAAADEKRVVGSSAFVTYGCTDEADLAIISLHNKYCMDNRDKPLQVSYCQKTEVISEFGFQHARTLHEINPANPIPAARPRPINLPSPSPLSEHPSHAEVSAQVLPPTEAPAPARKVASPSVPVAAEFTPPSAAAAVAAATPAAAAPAPVVAAPVKKAIDKRAEEFESVKSMAAA